MTQKILHHGDKNDKKRDKYNVDKSPEARLKKNL